MPRTRKHMTRCGENEPKNHVPGAPGHGRSRTHLPSARCASIGSPLHLGQGHSADLLWSPRPALFSLIIHTIIAIITTAAINIAITLAATATTLVIVVVDTCRCRL